MKKLLLATGIVWCLAPGTAGAQCMRVTGLALNNQGQPIISNQWSTMPFVAFRHHKVDEYGTPAPWCFDSHNVGVEVWFSEAPGPCYHNGVSNGQVCVSIASAQAEAGMSLPGACGVYTGRSLLLDVRSDGSSERIAQQQATVSGPNCVITEPEVCDSTNGFWEPELGEWLCYSPIIVPVGIRGDKYDVFRLTSAADGVNFDLTGDGVPERIGWTAKNARVGFLTIDRNKNGVVDNGTELLGNFTLPGVGNGFHALTVLFGQPNRADILETDPFFNTLLIWTDANHDGVSQATEIEPFSKYYVRIALGYRRDQTKDRFGNLFGFEGYAEVRHPGGRVDPFNDRAEYAARILKIYDVFFVTK